MRSLKSRLALSAGVWITLVLVVGGVALSYIFQHTADEAFRRRLEVLVSTLIAATDFNANGHVAITRSLGDARFEQALSGWYWQISENDKALARSRSLWDEDLLLDIKATEPGVSGSVSIMGPRQRTLWVSYRALQVEGFQNPLLFIVAGDVSSLMEDRRKFDLVLALSLVALGIGVLCALLFQIRYGLKPLNGLVRDLEAVRQRRAAKVDENYPDEILPLIRVTNAVLEENQNQIERARRHVGNLAHALKTPLTILRGEIREAAGSSEQGPVNEQIDTISGIVEYHLSRAAAAGTSSFAAKTVPLADTIKPICRSLEKIFAEEARNVYIDISPSVAFRGEREDMEEIAGNILENAFKWAKQDIHVSAVGDEDGLRIIVSDDGPGMTEGDMKTAIARGRRLDEMTPGHGLGLSIVADLVALYQGNLALKESDEGGLSVSIWFPPERLIW